MQAIEFEATTFQHTIRIPDTIPDGVSLRVLLLVDETKNRQQNIQKFAQFPSKLKLSHDEINARKPEYLTMTVDKIEMPTRDERYER